MSQRIWTTDGVLEGFDLKDGVDFINCYSKAATELGRAASNFSQLGFTHNQHGKFVSMEGYWHWIATGKLHDELRDLYGNEARKVGRSFEKVYNPHFKFEICSGLHCKAAQNPEFLKALSENKLPLAHHYTLGTRYFETPSEQRFWVSELAYIGRSYDF